jgi:hypothetical protein
MAASNATFWYQGRWNGSEEIIEESSHFLPRTPSSTRVDFLSASTLTTATVTVQGVCALYLTVINGSRGDAATFFAPLAIIGLYRLQSALWLSNDVVYSESRDSKTGVCNKPRSPPTEWRGVLFRSWWICSLTALAMFAGYECFGPFAPHCRCIPMSSVAQRVLYILLTFGLLVIHTFYLVRGQSKTTVIPCIQSTWYKMFTYLLILVAVVCLILSSMETRLHDGCKHGYDGTCTTCSTSQSFC